MSEITKTDRHTAKLPSQKKPNKKHKPRGPIPPQTTGDVYLTPKAAAATFGMSVAHFNRVQNQGKLKLKKYHFYPGATTRYSQAECEEKKAGGAE